jgi:hypothetical protein
MILRRWKRAKQARTDDWPVADGKVTWYTALIRFFKPLPKEKK